MRSRPIRLLFILAIKIKITPHTGPTVHLLNRQTAILLIFTTSLCIGLLACATDRYVHGALHHLGTSVRIRCELQFTQCHYE